MKKGKASIFVGIPNSKTAIFHEKGAWFVEKRAEIFFTNSFLWSLDVKSNMIALSHLRHSKERPVFLFHLTATKQNALESVDTHLCKDDTYLGSIFWNTKEIHFQMRIIGPKKMTRCSICISEHFTADLIPHRSLPLH